MAGICSAHPWYEPGCGLCNAIFAVDDPDSYDVRALLVSASKEIERLTSALSETVTRADLPSYSAELLAANYPTRTDASILSGPYTPTYIAAKRIEVAVAERDQLASMDDAAMDKMQAMIREQSERIVAVASYAENVVAAANNVIEECERRSADVEQGRARAITVPWLDLNVLRQTIAMKPGAHPAQPALGSLSSPQTGAQPERSETGQQIESKSPTRPRLQLGACAGCKQPIYGGQPHQMRHAGCEETDLRHQSCTQQRVEEAAGPKLVTLMMDAAFALERAVPGSILAGALNRAANKLQDAHKTDEWHAARSEFQVVREPASPWIRGRDRLPTENDVRFAYRMHDDGPTYCVDNRGEFDSEFGTDGPPEQIVWMPLPTVPDDPADAVLVACTKQDMRGVPACAECGALPDEKCVHEAPNKEE